MTSLSSRLGLAVALAGLATVGASAAIQVARPGSAAGRRLVPPPQTPIYLRERSPPLAAG